MTHKKLAAQAGLTLAQYQVERMAYLQNEGYDDEGREYATLSVWLMQHQQQACQPDPNEMAILACDRGEICGAI